MSFMWQLLHEISISQQILSAVSLVQRQKMLQLQPYGDTCHMASQISKNGLISTHYKAVQGMSSNSSKQLSFEFYFLLSFQLIPEETEDEPIPELRFPSWPGQRPSSGKFVIGLHKWTLTLSNSNSVENDVNFCIFFQEKSSQMMDKASNAAQSAKESSQEVYVQSIQ